MAHGDNRLLVAFTTKKFGDLYYLCRICDKGFLCWQGLSDHFTHNAHKNAESQVITMIRKVSSPCGLINTREVIKYFKLGSFMMSECVDSESTNQSHRLLRQSHILQEGGCYASICLPLFILCCLGDPLFLH